MVADSFISFWGNSCFKAIHPEPGHGFADVENCPTQGYLRECYSEMAQELFQLSLQDFHDSELIELRGAYRTVAVKPKNLSWRSVEPQEVRPRKKQSDTTSTQRLSNSNPASSRKV
eukprot:4807013-Amphidinium_carterae.2